MMCALQFLWFYEWIFWNPEAWQFLDALWSSVMVFKGPFLEILCSNKDDPLFSFFLWLDDCWMSSTKGLNLHIKRVINLSKLVFVIQCIYYKKKMPSSATYDKLFKVFSTASCRVWPITRCRLQTYYWYRWNSALTMADGCAPSTSKPVKVFLFCFFTVTQNSTIFIY